MSISYFNLEGYEYYNLKGNEYDKHNTCITEVEK